LNTNTAYPFKLGSMNAIAISDGSETVPIESVVKDVPGDLLRQALLEAGRSPTEAVVYFNCLYLQNGSHKILVDAGWGSGTQRRDGALLAQLQAEGIAPEDIDTIILTHGDVDHIGGILNRGNQLVFPNASYILLKEAWDFWSNEAIVSRWPEFLTVFSRKTLPLIRERIQVVEGGVEFLPGMRLAAAPGHRLGHTIVEIHSSGQHLIHLADCVGDELFFEHPGWHWYADFKPDQAEKNLAAVLERAADLQALVFGSHLPFPGLGRVAVEAGSWRWTPVKTA
jgi:glyoxylase-like metal-dependent hydrolase (beta-lactamase superfamily II)